MADVIEFPSKTVRDWAGFESAIREHFARVDTPAEIHDEVISKMHEFFNRYNKGFSVSLEFPPGITFTREQMEAIDSSYYRAGGEYQKQMQDMMSQVFLDLLLLEEELCILRHE